MSCHCALRARRNFLLTVYYSFCCSKSLVAILSSIWLHFLVKTPNTETPNTKTPKGQHSEGLKTPKSHDTSYPSLRQNIISYCCRVMSYWYIALIHHIILIYFVLISYTLITIIHYPGIISHHADIMLYFVVSYHMIRIFQLLIQYHTYISKPRQ